MATRGGVLAALMRRKVVSEEHMGDTGLARVLGLVDLCCLAIGSTLGLGIYVLAGDVAKKDAGPAVVISFLVAAVASLFAALCYAEFAARVPKAGSAYVYSYVCVGELVAFVIGWNLILEYVIGTASVARGYSTYVDSIFDKKMQGAFRDCCAINVDFLSGYPDFFAFSLVFVLSVLLAIGVKESTRFNNVFTVCNLVVVVYVIICGIFKSDVDNWKIDPSTVPNPGGKLDLGSGGFFPFGFSGVMAGAARCFYGFVGFDAVATTGEEAKNPQRAIPLSIVIGLAVIFACYFGVSAVMTLMWPYYLQDDDAPLPYVFDHLHWETARWIVTVGALFGLSSSLLGALFPLPRILYAMANDGLIFRSLSSIHPRFHTPFWSTLLSGLFAALMAALFDLGQLVDMMSIGTLLAYTLVAVCVLVLRFAPSPAEANRHRLLQQLYRDESLGLVDHDADGPGGLAIGASTDRLLPPRPSERGLLALVLNRPRLSQPSHRSAKLVNHVAVAYGVVTVAFCLVIVYGADALMAVEAWAVILAAILGAAMLACFGVVLLQPQSKAHLFFRVPLVPLLPMVSVFVNVYLMMKLSSATWVRFGVWMALGFCLYFGYGYHHSEAGLQSLEEATPLEPLHSDDGSEYSDHSERRKLVD
ncbi:high affinity cationic amino acid transporter 1-like [Pollicipes pollicipes]|uniref:high affinity cationic amino acid transporter 1-like n=1 Tax=Pollicipes pollicipes TaxID=41117 RepID=UPI001884DFDF|nr:high affinity cationic amino acid transporter 1-like [Pollicipes pollicipes]